MSPESRQHILWFRNSAPYINAHRGRTFVLVFGGEAALHPNFANIIHDIALLNSLGVRLVLIHGIRPQVVGRLEHAGIESVYHNGVRITDSAALEHAKEAAGALRTEIEALLSMGLPNSPMQGSSIRVCSGNFVTARPTGIVDGVDYHLTGRVRRIDARGIAVNLDAGAIVLLPPLGYSPTGEIFNLALEDMAVHTASAIGADKLVLFSESRGIMNPEGRLVRQCDTDEALELIQQLEDPEQKRLLQTARDACNAGIKRCHIISHGEEGELLQELFTHDGGGTLVDNEGYERARGATIDDVGGILELIGPLERDGVLVKRSRESLEMEIGQFRVLDRDGRIIACAALYPYPEEGCAELACVVTHPDYRGGDRGQRLLHDLEERAAAMGLDRVFVLTTQTAHWFIEQGFVQADLGELPAKKKSLYNLQRNSRVFVKTLA
jgi:amino-acid N-acetyltransferase